MNIYNIKGLLIVLISVYHFTIFAQSVPTPAKSQSKPILLTGGVAHLGNGKVIENSSIGFENGKITLIESGTSNIDQSKYEVIDVKGKHIYPGFIAPNTTLGLGEIGAVRATNDFNEVGAINPNVRSIISYNADSRVTPTVRSNGVLLAQITPQGGILTGSSSIVELDAWNWEDAAYKMDDAIHLNWPRLIIKKGWWAEDEPNERNDKYLKAISDIEQLFDEAKAYAEINHTEKNLRLEAMKGLFDGSKQLFIQANYIKEILSAIDFANKYKVKMVLVGGDDAWMVTDELKKNNIPVVLGEVHALPGRREDDIDLPYKLPAILQKEGILYCLSGAGRNWEQRNLMFQAGTAAGYGLTKEEALMSITSNTAKILGINDRVGTLEKGKDATLFISEGDALDMKTSIIQIAFIRGKQIDLGNKQKDLYKKFASKYGQEIQQ